MKRGIIVGKEERRWMPAGETQEQVSRALYVLWDPPKQEEDGFSGRRVEVVRPRFDISKIEVGSYCEFEYDIRSTSKGSMAVLCGIEMLRPYNIVLEPLN